MDGGNKLFLLGASPMKTVTLIRQITMSSMLLLFVLQCSFYYDWKIGNLIDSATETINKALIKDEDASSLNDRIAIIKELNERLEQLNEEKQSILTSYKAPLSDSTNFVKKHETKLTPLLHSYIKLKKRGMVLVNANKNHKELMDAANSADAQLKRLIGINFEDKKKP